MMRKLVCLLFGVCATVPLTAHADDTLAGALAAIPKDAMGFICVPSIESLDGDYQQAISDLGLQQLVQPPMNSLVGMVKQFVPFLEGIDETGSLALVFMPVEHIFELQMKQVILIPTKDPRAMIEAMQGQAAEEGLWSVTIQGQPAYVAAGKGRLIVANQLETAKAVKDSSASISAKLKSHEKRGMEGMDLVVWLDSNRLLTVVKPMIDGIIAPVLMMQQSSGGFQAKSAELNKKQIDMMVDGMSSLMLGVSLDKRGLGLRFAMTGKPGSEMAKQLKVKNTSDSLLQGLPGGKYVLAFGQTADPEQTRATLKDYLDTWFDLGTETDKVDTEKLGQLKSLIEEAAPMITGLRGSVEALPAGSDGLFGMAIIVDTSDNDKALELKGKMIELGREILADSAKRTEDDDLKQFHDALTYEKDAEVIAGVKVQHLKLDLAKVEDIDEEDREDVLKVIGKEGVLIRMAPVGARKIVAGFGGGKERMASLIEQARTNEAPLDNDTGIRKTAHAVPKMRASVAYVAVDRILAAVSRVADVLEEEPLPVQMPLLDAPLTLASSGGDGCAQFDMFVPTALLIASKDAAMVVMGQTQASEDAAAPSASQEPEKP